MAIKRTFKPLASEIAFYNRGKGISAPDVQSAIERVHEMKVFGGVNNLKDLGAQGDGITDDTSVLKAADSPIAIPRGTYRITDVITKKIPLHIRGYDATIVQETVDTSNLRFEDTGGAPVRGPFVEGITATQPDSVESNGDSPFKFSGVVYPLLAFYRVIKSGLGVSLAYGNITLPDRRTKWGLIIGGYLENLSKMGIEIIGSAYNSVVANIINGIRGDSHGIRITGYAQPGDSTTAPADGNVGAGNIVSGMATGLSVQNTGAHACFSALHSTENGIAVQILKGTVPENDPRHLHIQFTSKNDQRGIYNQGSYLSVFDFAIENTALSAIEEIANETAAGRNTYRGTIRNTGATAVILRHPGGNLDLTIDGSANNGVSITSGSNGWVGKLNIRNVTGTALSVASDGNNLYVTCDNKPIVVSGNGNVLHVNTDGNLTISGNNNQIIGRVGGTITNTGANNDLSGIKGMVGHGNLLVDTNSSGHFSVNHGLKMRPTYIQAQIRGSGTPHTYAIRPVAWNESAIQFLVFDTSTGEAVTDTTGINVNWFARV